MDQDRELFKLQVAAQHYESSLQMRVTYLDAFILGVLILSMGAYLAQQVPWFGAVLAWLGCSVVFVWRLRSSFEEYTHRIEKLDAHLQKVERGQRAPTLKELIDE